MAGAGFRRLPPPPLQPLLSQALTVNRGPAGPRALRGPPRPPRPPAAARGRLPTRSALGSTTPLPLHSQKPAEPARMQERRGAVARVGRRPPCPPDPTRSQLVQTQRWRGQLLTPRPDQRVQLRANTYSRCSRALGTFHPFSFPGFQGRLRNLVFAFVVSNFTAEGAAHAGAQGKLWQQN